MIMKCIFYGNKRIGGRARRSVIDVLFVVQILFTMISCESSCLEVFMSTPYTEGLNTQGLMSTHVVVGTDGTCPCMLWRARALYIPVH